VPSTARFGGGWPKRYPCQGSFLRQHSGLQRIARCADLISGWDIDLIQIIQHRFNGSINNTNRTLEDPEASLRAPHTAIYRGVANLTGGGEFN